ncbi:hypothetical protein O59_000280 [Cellvibrio sp. BR]|uniref:Wzz/FepE/Etk N-terminal domain-containing protein n=1 Tax=unclassified Cellvibrio TaxID=2624793 RepID=UPI0002601613|nr:MULTISPECIES: Wzz/FepE/Etk N-terminal domain-containing protein [unclassified Cellvibrio]EIK46259.1 hypothetical protein O59_000280 [Cellvibrio sp. BR]UUA71831.1 Wzz/FepE/Etk N-terminal domain-containing protein [Cellvibrio sp. QJXJ]
MNTHQNTFQNHSYEREEEIDLLELCATVWRKKWLILALVVVSAIATGLWLKWLPSTYRLEVLFDSTSPYDIQALQPAILSGGSQYAVAPLKTEDFYQEVLIQASSLNTQKLFWERWSQQPLSEDPSIESTANDRAFKKFFISLALTPPNPKSPNVTLSQITLETPAPGRDIETLTAYVDFLNRHVVEKFVAQLEKAYASNLQQLDFDYQALQKRELQKLEDNLLQLQESLKLAQSLNIIDTPYEQLTGVELKVVDDRQYLLGTRVLSEEIKSLEARRKEQLSAFSPELRNMESWRNILENDLKKIRTLKDDVQAFRLAGPVVSSLDPVKPKKLLILLGAIFSSAFIGVFIALVSHAIKNYQARPENRF